MKKGQSNSYLICFGKISTYLYKNHKVKGELAMKYFIQALLFGKTKYG